MLHDLFYMVRNLFHRRSMEAELDAELRAHIEQQTEKYIKSGMSPEAAGRRARLELGGVEQIKEDVRDSWGVRTISELAQDVRYGLRQLRRNPGFAIVAILTLTLSIGANTAIFSLADAVMFRMLPVANPGELFQLRYTSPDSTHDLSQFTNSMWEQVHKYQNVFSGAFAWSNVDELSLVQGGTEQIANGLWVSGSFFSTLGLRPAAGRLIGGSDDRRGCPAIGVLSYGFWQGLYGGTKTAIGGTLSLNGHPVEVIGVAPRGFDGMDVGERFDVALPICATAIIHHSQSRLENRSMYWLNVAERVSLRMREMQLAASLSALSPKVFRSAVPLDSPPEVRRAYLKMALAVVPVGSGVSSLRGEFSLPLKILLAVAGFVLLIACANIAGLMLARGAARRKEIAVRLALGASRVRVVRQLLTECVLLSSAGALLGMLFAHWSAPLLVRMVSTTQEAVFVNLSPDSRTLGFVLGITLFTAVLFGLLPALSSTQLPLISAMKGIQSSDIKQPVPLRSRKWITASQVAISFLLLVTCGLLLRTFVRLVTLNIGFDPHDVLLVHVNLKTANVPPSRNLDTNQEIESRLSALPGVLSASRSGVTPMSGAGWCKFTIHSDWSKSVTGINRLAFFNFVSPDYLSTMRTPMLAGRGFTRADAQNSRDVAVVNQSMTRRFFPGLNPIGRVFWIDQRDRQIEVIGVMQDSKYGMVQEVSHPTIFMLDSHAPSPTWDTSMETFELRTAILPSGLISPARGTVAAVNNAIPVQFDTLTERVEDSLVQQRVMALLSGFFGVLALLLGMVGIFGTISYLVTQRQNEIGIRMALGAEKRDVLRMVIGQGLKLALIGVIIGIAGALALTRFLASLLYGVKPTDPLTFIAVSLILMAVALLACYIPARRAAKVDPMVALRYE